MASPFKDQIVNACNAVSDIYSQMAKLNENRSKQQLNDHEEEKTPQTKKNLEVETPVIDMIEQTGIIENKFQFTTPKPKTQKRS